MADLQNSCDDCLDFTRGETGGLAKKTYSPLPPTSPCCAIPASGQGGLSKPTAQLLYTPLPQLCLCLFLAPVGPIHVSFCLESAVCPSGSVHLSVCCFQPFCLSSSACPYVAISICLVI